MIDRGQSALKKIEKMKKIQEMSELMNPIGSIANDVDYSNISQSLPVQKKGRIEVNGVRTEILITGLFFL